MGFSGSIDGMRMMEILDSVQLDFFDQFMKGKPVRYGVHTGFPEIEVRQLP